MAINYAAKQVKVQFKIGDIEIPVNSIKLRHTIDELPYIQVSVQVDNHDAKSSGVARIGSVKLDLKRFGKLNKVMQEKIFNDFALLPDTACAVHDGEGNEIKFVGFVGNPAFRLIEGDLQLGMDAVHHMAVLQAFNGQIYAERDRYALPFLHDYFSDSASNTDALVAQSAEASFAGDLFAEVKLLGSIAKELERLKNAPKRNDSVAATIRVILEELHRRYVAAANLETGQLDTFPVFNLNSKSIKYASEFLKRSEPLTLIDGLSDVNFIPDNFFKSIYWALVNHPNLLVAINAFRNMFLLQMNASWDGKAWLEHLFTVHPPEGRLIRTPITDIIYNTARLFEIPIVQVLVQAGGSSFYILQGEQGVNIGDQPQAITPVDQGEIIRATIDRGETTLKAIAKYPLTVKSTAAGNYYLIQAPFWIPEDQFHREDIDNPKKVEEMSKFNLAPDLYKVLREQLKNQNKAKQNIMDYLAKFTFQDIILQGTSALMTVPLNLKAAVGRTYKVETMEGDEVLTGYLRSVSHDIVLSREAGSATSTLQFSHIRAAGAVINSIDKKDFPKPFVGDINAGFQSIA